MAFSLTGLFFAVVAYLSLLFLIAYATEHGRIPAGIARHPLTYVLSLGVYATSWSYYGSVGFAQSQGYNFLTIYLGVTLAFVLTPVLLQPILRLVREYQLTSIADLFAFRFRSQIAGIVVTLFMLAGVLPYLALQIRAVTESLRVLTQEATPMVLGLGFCVILILFAILFGARHISPREKHEGLVVAIAFESLIKLVALLLVGAFAVYGVFGGFHGMTNWLQQNPDTLSAMYKPAREGAWSTLLFLAFAAAFLLPRQFHMTFTENIEPRGLPVASWAFPLYLLLLNLAIPPILWAGQSLGTSTDPDYYVLGITLSGASHWLPVIAFLGGVSAASAMVIVTTVALSAMCLNHIILPASYPDPTVNLYRWLLWGRRMIIAVIVLAGYGFYVTLENNQGLVQLGLISFVAVAQFIPGILGVLYWPRANRYGFLSGLAGGAMVWIVTLIIPLVEQSGGLKTGFSLDPWLAYTHMDKWSFATFWSLALNSFLFIVVSLLTPQNVEEAEAAAACSTGSFTPSGGVLQATSVPEFVDRLASVTGHDMAAREVQQALDDIGLTPDVKQPAQLRRLRAQIERNLSGLIGPEMARMLVNRQLQMDRRAQTALADTIRMVEERLEESRTRLRGLAAELDSLRRYHREVLLELPVGVCSVAPDRSVVIWNKAMASISQIEPWSAIGVKVNNLVAPWGDLFTRFLTAQDQHADRVQVLVGNKARWLSLHKARLEGAPAVYAMDTDAQQQATVLLVEDLTETRMLEAELAHSERLAMIGRLAAGVAHEIGNPVTGIACLAQNMRAENADSDARQSIDEILEQTKRINAIVHSLVSFSHGGRYDVEPVTFPVRECIQEAVRLVQLADRGKHIEFDNRVRDALTVLGDRQRLLQVFVNVLSNACDASSRDGKIEISAEPGDGVTSIQVRDEGCGISRDEIDRIFEPFFTTKQPGEGTGLGLALAYNIVKDHGGEISVVSDKGIGTRVMIRLPAVPDTLGESVQALAQ